MIHKKPDAAATDPAAETLKVAIVGSGPSGFYAAEALLASGLQVEVDMLERLPVPYGLVRYGVAPDHAKLKTVAVAFAQIAQDPRFRFFGNVELGREVDVAQLGEMYHAIVVATGAARDRKLGIAGEDLPGVHAASDFVGWYNGRPECANLEFDLSQEVAVVVGQGNVALDVCRILSKPVEALRGTDIAEHALRALQRSRIKEIHLVGRRGPVQAKFTPKELRELGAIPGWQPMVDLSCLALNDASREELGDASFFHAAKNHQLLQGYAAAPLRNEKRIHLHFHSAPIALHGSSRLESVRIEEQELEGPATSQRAVGTGRVRDLFAGLLFRSVGYRGSSLPGLPFDEHASVLPNAEGRVMLNARLLLRWYVTGWIKRGPTGIIGTNRADSIETVNSLVADLHLLRAARDGRRALVELLARTDHPVIEFHHWLEIERSEAERGAKTMKTAEKFVCLNEMLAVGLGRTQRDVAGAFPC